MIGYMFNIWRRDRSYYTAHELTNFIDFWVSTQHIFEKLLRIEYNVILRIAHVRSNYVIFEIRTGDFESISAMEDACNTCTNTPTQLSCRTHGVETYFT